jgi:hypothetical protein
MNTSKLTIIAVVIAVSLAGTAWADEAATDSIIPEFAAGIEQASDEIAETPRVSYLLDDSVYGSTYAEDSAYAVSVGDTCGSNCGCGSDCGCCDSCGDGCCSSCSSDSWFGDCCLGDPCTLHDELTPCCKTNYGGWIQISYHSDTTGLSQDFNDGLAFNDLPDQINLQQAWVFVERTPEAECCSSDWGYRFDMMYGTDAQKLQANGNPRADNFGQGRWDASFDHGYYGWAMPQAYAEAGFGDWTVKAGKFITPLGYEYVTAPQNFFYSHSLSSFNSEPFTHTGVLATYEASDGLKVYNGWTLGWDTGFDQFGGGSSYLGGFEAEMSDCVTFAYLTTVGNLGYRSGDEFGYSHGTYITLEMSDSMEYGLYSVYSNSDGSFGDPTTDLEDLSVVNYLFYEVNDCWAFGGRMEWWKSDQVTGEATSFYELTGGINYKPHANVVVRPEIRYDWTPSEGAVGAYNREVFAVDVVLTY